ncbi:MAG: hypothetical protein HQK49_02905 [Oligoflexia bacterium]|nr:hypothetical protein [Oligoflexia bacterium]
MRLRIKMRHTPNGSNSTLVAIELPKVKWHHRAPSTIDQVLRQLFSHLVLMV